MTDTDLEARISRLERQSTLWKLLALGATLVAGALVMNACSAKAAPPPQDMHFKDGVNEVTVNATGVTVHGPSSEITIGADQIVIDHGKRRITMGRDMIQFAGETATAAIEPDAFSLGTKDQHFEARLGPNGPTLSLTNGNQDVQLAAYANVSSVMARGYIPSPSEEISAGLYATAGAASVEANRIGEKKSLGVEKGTPKPTK
ncbi:MAG TPA: hypothetical protein VGM39_17235 [Kofleriaceae bacterium]|jgi:hypothetical protein